MAECFDVEMKEMLPEFASGTLDAESRSLVDDHLVRCGDCRDDLAVLHTVQSVVIPAAHINIPRMLQALPPAPVPVRDDLPWYRRASLQLAASLLLVAGGLIAVRQAGDRVGMATVASETRSIPALPLAIPDRGAEKTVNFPVEKPAVQPKPGIALVSGLDDLNAKELTALLAEIDGIAAVPVAEPENFAPLSASGLSGES